jgi:hypothetical protein
MARGPTSVCLAHARRLPPAALPYRDELGRVSLHLLRDSLSKVEAGSVAPSEDVVKTLRKWLKHAEKEVGGEQHAWERLDDGTWRAPDGEVREVVETGGARTPRSTARSTAHHIALHHSTSHQSSQHAYPTVLPHAAATPPTAQHTRAPYPVHLAGETDEEDDGEESSEPSDDDDDGMGMAEGMAEGMEGMEASAASSKRKAVEGSVGEEDDVAPKRPCAEAVPCA